MKCALLISATLVWNRNRTFYAPKWNDCDLPSLIKNLRQNFSIVLLKKLDAEWKLMKCWTKRI